MLHGGSLIALETQKYSRVAWPVVRSRSQLVPCRVSEQPQHGHGAACPARRVCAVQVAQQLRLAPGGEAHIRALSPPFARALLGLMSACGDRITSQPAWETLLTLLENTSSHPDAVLPAAAALDSLCRRGRGMCTANFMHVVTAVRTLATNACGLLTAAAHARATGRNVDMPFSVEEVRDMVNLLELMAGWLQTWRQRQAQVRHRSARHRRLELLAPGRVRPCRWQPTRPAFSVHPRAGDAMPAPPLVFNTACMDNA